MLAGVQPKERAVCGENEGNTREISSHVKHKGTTSSLNDVQYCTYKKNLNFISETSSVLSDLSLLLTFYTIFQSFGKNSTTTAILKMHLRCITRLEML